MALVYVGGTSGNGTGATYNVSLSGTLTGGIASSPSPGDIVIVATGFGLNASAAPTCSGNNSGAYTGAHTALYSNDTWDSNFRTFYFIQGSSVDTTLTIGRTSNAAYGGAAVVHVWRGIDSTNPLDVTTTTAATANQSSSIINCPSITPTTTGAIVIAAGIGMQTTAGAAFTIPSGMTNGVSVKSDGTTTDAGVFIASFAWTSGTYDPAVVTGGTTSTSSSWAGATLALRPAPPAAINAESTSYTLTGQDATLSRAYSPLNAESTSFSLTGQNATLGFARSLNLESSSFTLTGQATTLVRTFAPINAEAGSYALTGQDAEFDRTFATNDVIFVADLGAFDVTGQDASLVRTVVFNAEAASEGQYQSDYVDPTYVEGIGYKIDWQSYHDGTYVQPEYVSGSGATLAYGRNFSAESSSFVITGQNVTLAYASVFPDPSDVRQGVFYGPGGIYEGTLVSTGGATLSRWDGSQWVDQQLRYWNGSAWV